MPAVPTRLPRRSSGVRTFAFPTAMSDVSGFCTSAPTDTSSAPVSRASSSSGW
jgi:hypothetical protein